ncbi:MAG: hypothetical protein LBS85_00535 [Clostridiales Family XIII bacterium]|nr:hypothetical protein [Clostridiales Family XIII bacterium]
MVKRKCDEIEKAPILIKRVNEKAVNIRKKPYGEIIGVISADDYSAYSAAEGGTWYKIEKGYVLAAFFEEVAAPAGPEPGSEVESE